MEIDHIPGYSKEARLIDLQKANGFALFLFLPVILLYGVPFYLIWGQDGLMLMNLKELFKEIPLVSVIGAVLITIVGIILHELIHGVTWSLFAKNGFKSIKFGFLLKMLTPYCHCKEPLYVWQYIIGGLMPALLLGVLPCIYAWWNGSFGMLLFAIFFTVSAAGDFMIVRLIWGEDKQHLVLDHPSEAGCFIYKRD
jgi:hypothetical protein